jgi:hypothetical protein
VPRNASPMSRQARVGLVLVAAAALVATAVGITYSSFSSTTSNPSSSFSAAPTFCTRTSAVWLTGFESGAVSSAGGGLFTTLTGVPTADAASFRSGAYSLRIADAAAGSTVGALKTFAATNVVVARFAIRLSALPGVSSSLVYVDSGTDLVFGYDQPSQKFSLTLGASTATSASTVSAGAWYVIDLRYDLRANPNLGDWRVDGVAQTQVTRAAAASTANGFGLGATTNASIYTANFDDLLVANQAKAYPIGNGKVVRLIRDGVGTHNTPGDFRDDDNTAVDAASWQRVDDVPMTGTADYVLQLTNSATSYLELTFGNTTATCIREVSAVVAYRSATTAANTGKTSVFAGGTESVVFSGDMSETTSTYASAIVTPASAAWTQAAVNGLVTRIGYASDANPDPYWDGLMLELAVP